jgi:GNAT superfamily N-acetyltransferase
MNVDTVRRVHLAWRTLAGVRDGFTSPLCVAVAPGSRINPPGWVGAVTLAGRTLVTAPTAGHAERLGALLDGTAEVFTVLTAAAAEVLGPARLAYLDPEAFAPVPGDVEAVTAAEVAGLEDAAGDADAGEAGVGESTSPVFVARVAGQVVAASGYRDWDGALAHVGVLTHPDHRNRGHARVVATAATAHALAAGLVPQWRARVPASRAVARSLGYEDLGDQLSVRLDDAG